MTGPATGGMGAHVAGLVTALPALGWAVTVFTSPRTAARFDLGDRVVTGWPDRPATAGRSLPGLRRLVADADVVHAHGHQAGLVAVLVARSLPARRRPAVVISWHNAVLVGGVRGGVLALAEWLQARGADLLTGASADLVERAERLGARGAQLAEVASPLRPAATPARHPDVLRPGPVVLTVSRIAPQKRLDLVVEAAARLGVRFPDLRWLVAGDGDDALLADLQRRTAELAAPVTFLGARSDVPALLAGADVFALASEWEARALVVQEAMGAGLPVVVPAVGGLPGLLGPAGPDGPAGLLVTPGDAAELAAAVGRVLADPALAARLAGAAVERFAGLPTEADVVAWWSARYRALLS